MKDLLRDAFDILSGLKEIKVLMLDCQFIATSVKSNRQPDTSAHLFNSYPKDMHEIVRKASCSVDMLIDRHQSDGVCRSRRNRAAPDAHRFLG
jgi:hypothetical protein